MKPLFALLVVAFFPALAPAASSVSANAPIANFRLPILNNDGARTSLVRGSEARYISSSQIDIVNLHYAMFAEPGGKRVDTTLVAPAASVLVDGKDIKVHGNESMRLVRDDLDVTGEQWTYDHTQKRVLIQKNVRVTFQVVLQDILK